MSEFLTVQIGQCGNQIGSAFWPLALEEYGIKNVQGGTGQSNEISKNLQASMSSFFNISPEKKLPRNFNQFKHKARAVLIDMEDSVISLIRNGPLRSLYDDRCIVTDYPGSGNNWARGFCQHGPTQREKILNAVRNAAETCDSLHGFSLLYSVGGGTGSGLGSYTLQLLEDNFPKIDRFVTCVYPTGTEDVTTCPYNMALATERLLDGATCVFPVENARVFEIVEGQIGDWRSVDTVRFVSKCKPFQDANSLIVKALLHLTCGSRFHGSLNLDMNDIATNMTPFPKTHFLATSFSPLSISAFKPLRIINSRQIQNEIFDGCCKRTNVLTKIDPLGTNSRLMATTLLGRGDFAMSDMRAYVEKVKSKRIHSPWSKNSVKIGLCDVATAGHSLSMLAIFNSTAMKTLFETINEHFEKLYRKRAYLHHYMGIQGFDGSFFDESREALFEAVNNYEELETMPKINVPRFRVE